MLIDILGLTFKPFPSYPIKMITDLHCFTSPGLTSHTVIAGCEIMPLKFHSIPF